MWEQDNTYDRFYENWLRISAQLEVVGIISNAQLLTEMNTLFILENNYCYSDHLLN